MNLPRFVTENSLCGRVEQIPCWNVGHRLIEGFHGPQRQHAPGKHKSSKASVLLCNGVCSTSLSFIPGSTVTCSVSDSRANLTLLHCSHSCVWNCWNMPGPSCFVTILFLQLHCRFPLAGLITFLSLVTCSQALQELATASCTESMIKQTSQEMDAA